MTTEPTSNKKKLEYVPSAQFGFTDVDKEKDTVYKMTDAVNKTGRFLADQAQQYRLTEPNGSTKAWTAVNVGDITKFFTGVRVGLFHVNPTDVSKMTDKAGLPVAYQSLYFTAEFNTVQGGNARVTIYPQIAPATALPITTIWYNQTTGKIGLTEGRSSDTTNDAKYQHPQLTRADGTAIYLPGKTNWDTLKQTGYYFNQNIGVNTPVGGGYFSLEVIATSGTSYITQRATQSNGDVYIRIYNDKWSPWALQATTSYVDNKVKTTFDSGQVYKTTDNNGDYKYRFNNVSDNVEGTLSQHTISTGSIFIAAGNPFIAKLGAQSFFGYVYNLNMGDVGYIEGVTRNGYTWRNIRVSSKTWSGWQAISSLGDLEWTRDKLQGKIDNTQVYKLTTDNGSAFNFPVGKTLDTLKEVGTYYGVSQTDPSNPTPGGGNYKVEVTSIQNNIPKMQELTDMFTGAQFRRLWLSDGWRAWNRVQMHYYESYKIPLNTSMVRDYSSDFPLTLDYTNGVVSLNGGVSPLKEIASTNDGFIVGTIADIQYRPNRKVHALCQGSYDHFFLLTIGSDGVMVMSRNRSKDNYNLAFFKDEWCNLDVSYVTNDTHYA